MLDQLPEEGLVGIGEDIVEADAGTYEDLLYSGKLPQGAKDAREVFPMIDSKLRAGFGREA